MHERPLNQRKRRGDSLAILTGVASVETIMLTHNYFLGLIAFFVGLTAQSIQYLPKYESNEETIPWSSVRAATITSVSGIVTAGIISLGQ